MPLILSGRLSQLGNGRLETGIFRLNSGDLGSAAAPAGSGPTEGRDAERLRTGSGQLRWGAPRCRGRPHRAGSCLQVWCGSSGACCAVSVCLASPRSPHTRPHHLALLTLHRYDVCRSSELRQRAGRRAAAAWWLARQAAHRRPVGPVVAVHAHVVFLVRPPASLPA